MIWQREIEAKLSVEQALRAMASKPGVALLDSGRRAYGLGNWSILAWSPSGSLDFRCGKAHLKVADGHMESVDNPLDSLRRLAAGRSRTEPGSLPFAGGAIGYFAYDFGRTLERLPEVAEPDPSAWGFRFGLYRGAVLWDHATKRVVLASADPEGEAVLEAMESDLRGSPDDDQPNLAIKVGELHSNFSRNRFTDAVETIRTYIRDGDIYQANLSQRFEAPFEGSDLELYLQLRRENPAPYGAYLKYEDETILSSSPEQFLWAGGGLVETRPIKGTRPLGIDPEEQKANRKALATSAKDRAELLMIIDLVRNDLGKVCQPGSVEVDRLFELESYASVVHQTGVVRGRLEDGRDALDCLMALFPGGSITGAPKIRAMEVIEELEPHRRGIYTGSIGYLGCDGCAHFNIAIRTLRRARDRIAFHAGAGIVWDSDAEGEYQETLDKAGAIFAALGKGFRE